MTLPKLNTPQYELELPSTGGKIKYRPFLVKEQKLLMMAQESENDDQISNTIISIINSCTDGKLDATKLPIFDVEYIFLQLRSKSVGETSKIKFKIPISFGFSISNTINKISSSPIISLGRGETAVTFG